MDGGELFWKAPSIPRGDLAQRRVKARLQAEAYALLGIDAMTLGPGDLAIGVDQAFGLIGEHQLPVLGGNLACGAHTLPTSRVVERGGRRVGFIGVVGGEVPAPCTLGDGLEAVRRGVAELGAVDVVVLLHTQGRAFSDTVGAQVPEVDLLLDGTQSAAWGSPRVVAEGAAWELGAGPQGKKLGLATLEFVAGAQGWVSTGQGAELERQLERVRSRRDEAQSQVKAAPDEASRERLQRRVELYERQVTELEAQVQALGGGGEALRNRLGHELLDLSREVPDHAPTQALVQAALAQLATTPSEDTDTRPSGAFVGSAGCRACHTAAYAQWAGTPHAQAWQSLVAAQRHLDRDCYSCHVTGALHPLGPQSPEAVGPLMNVGCESCHGPGTAHALNPSAAPMSTTVEPTVCTGCHDGTRDEGRFDQDTYWPKVLHGSGG